MAFAAECASVRERESYTFEYLTLVQNRTYTTYIYAVLLMMANGRSAVCGRVKREWASGLDAAAPGARKQYSAADCCVTRTT